MSVSEEEKIDEDSFIAAVRDHQMLYDTKHLQYRDMQLKEKTWERIAKEFRMDKFTCKKKWRHLRDGYQRYKKTHRKEFKTSNRPLIARYARLRFLDKVFTPRKPQYDVSSDNDPDDDQDDSTANDDEKPTTNVKQEIDNIPFEQEDYSDNNTERDNIFVMQHEPITSDINTNKIQCNKKDDVEYFCLHVAEVLRKLPPVEKAKAKKQLNDVLFEYELMAAHSSRETPTTSMG